MFQLSHHVLVRPELLTQGRRMLTAAVTSFWLIQCANGCWSV